MDHFAGLDVSVKETSICIVDDTGRIVRKVVASEPEALLKVLGNPTYHFKRIGLEAGPLSQWLFSALAGAELPVICVETRHMQAVLKVQINADAEAVAWLRQSVEANRNTTLVHFVLAAALALLGHVDQARAAAHAGLALDPTFTIRRFRVNALSDNSTFLARRERTYQGMRMAGVPEG